MMFGNLRSKGGQRGQRSLSQVLIESKNKSGTHFTGAKLIPLPSPQGVWVGSFKLCLNGSLPNFYFCCVLCSSYRLALTQLQISFLSYSRKFNYGILKEVETALCKLENLLVIQILRNNVYLKPHTHTDPTHAYYTIHSVFQSDHSGEFRELTHHSLAPLWVF